MLTADAAQNYHCPRWDELPALRLYMDQMIMIVTSALEVFAHDGEAVITPTMVNNYVKQKIITPPEKKRYERSQITYLIVLCFFKRVFSMNEITQVISIIKKRLGSKNAYDLFCQRLEEMLEKAYNGGGLSIPGGQINDPVEGILNTALAAVVSKLVVQGYIAAASPPPLEVNEKATQPK